MPNGWATAAPHTHRTPAHLYSYIVWPQVLASCTHRQAAHRLPHRARATIAPPSFSQAAPQRATRTLFERRAPGMRLHGRRFGRCPGAAMRGQSRGNAGAAMRGQSRGSASVQLHCLRPRRRAEQLPQPTRVGAAPRWRSFLFWRPLLSRPHLRPDLCRQIAQSRTGKGRVGSGALWRPDSSRSKRRGAGAGCIFRPERRGRPRERCFPPRHALHHLRLGARREVARVGETEPRGAAERPCAGAQACAAAPAAALYPAPVH